jgi:preprotein translocase subunit SecD
VTRQAVVWLVAVVGALVVVLPTFGRMPYWWPWEDPVRLGLDLRGGTHLLYGVDLDEAVTLRLGALGREVEQTLREQRVGAFTADADEGRLLVRLANPDRQREVRTLLEERLSGYVVAEQGDRSIEVELSERERLRIRGDTVEQALQILRNRIDQFGVAEPTLLAQGDDEIVIQLPGIQDPQRAKELIGRTAVLEFKLLAEGPEAGTLDSPGAGTEVLSGIGDTGGRQRFLVEKRGIMTGEVVTDASVRRDIDGYYIDFVLDGRGTKLFGDATRANVRRALAIILDGQVQSAPVIQEPITGGRGQISGRFTVEEAQDLANVLRNGALPAPLNLMEERTVGPSLGRDSIRQGSLSFAVGGILVVAFMFAYYRGGGLVANLALLTNILLVLGVFALFGFTLTLPGIAGIVLTVGMAVDANVLILERVREELRSGRKARAAIDAGYERAWSAILDSNVTTFLSGLILFQFGTGPVRGFAATLCVGIVTSLLTAVYGTRMIYDWLASNHRLESVSV